MKMMNEWKKKEIKKEKKTCVYFRQKKNCSLSQLTRNKRKCRKNSNKITKKKQNERINFLKLINICNNNNCQWCGSFISNEELQSIVFVFTVATVAAANRQTFFCSYWLFTEIVDL